MNQTNLFKEFEELFKEEGLEVKGKKEKSYPYSPFALQDALGEKNVKKIWIEYQKLRIAGIDSEDLIHKIISKIRDMTAIKMGASREDLDIKEYPFNKSKKDLKNWKTEDLKSFYTRLIEIYHYSRMGKHGDDYSGSRGQGLEVAIEKTILNI